MSIACFLVLARMTAKQERFVAEYLIDLNATQAAIRAGYSPKTAQEQSSRLLSKAMVAEAIAKATKTQLEEADIKAKDVLKQTKHVAFSDPRKLFKSRQMLHPEDWSDEVAAAFLPLEITKRNLTAGDGVQEDVVKVKAWDKMKALEILAKHLGLLDQHLEVDVTVNIAQAIREGRERVRLLGPAS